MVDVDVGGGGPGLVVVGREPGARGGGAGGVGEDVEAVAFEDEFSGSGVRCF